MTVIYSELSPHPDLTKALKIADKGRENAFATAALGLPSLFQKHISIIGMGATLKQPGSFAGQTILDQLNAAKMVKVVAGSAHRLLHDARLGDADYAVIGFADADMAHMIEPRVGVTYIVAAQADPAIARKIKDAGAKIYVFDAYIPQHYGEDSIGIGSTAATAALAVFANLGWKSFQFYGVDSIVTYADGTTPVGAAQMVVKVGNRDFVVDRGFYEQQTKEFLRFQAVHRDITMHFHGDSLNAAIMNASSVPSPSPVIRQLSSP